MHGLFGLTPSKSFASSQEHAASKRISRQTLLMHALGYFLQ